MTFTATCSPTTRPAVAINYVDLSGVSRQSSSLTFTDVAPVVTSPTVRTVDYHGTAADGTVGPLHSLQVTINPVSAVRQPSQCSLTADPNPVALDSTTRLVATCAAGDPVTRYEFSAPSGAVIQDGPNNSVVITPTALGTSRYLVIAYNAGGSQAVTTNVTVVPPAPSGCTLAASPNPIVLGQSSTLTAQCSGRGTPTEYRFTAPDGSTIVQASPTLVVTPRAAGSQAYSVVAANATGASQPAPATLVVQPATCTVTPSVPNPIPRGTSVTLTAACNNNPVSYTFSTAAGPLPGSAASTTVVPTTTTTYTVNAINASVVPITATGQYTVIVVGASTIAAVPGATITGSPGRPISRPLQVRVTDAQGNPFNAESVTWTVVGGGASPGTFASNPTLSNAQGIATNTFTYGADAGPRTLRACLTTLPTQCADFQVVPGATQIAAVIASPLTGAPGRPLSGELVARVSDASGNPVAGELVNWTVVNPGTSPGTFGANQTGPTDAQGLTRNTFTLGNDAGPRTLRACLASLPTVCADFPVSVPAASGLVVIAGSPLVGTPNRPLTRPVQVRATNAQGQPVAGERINWTVVNPTPGSGTFGSPQTGPTDATGLTQNTFTLGSDPGARTLRACLVSQPSVCVDIQVQSITAVVDGPATKIMTPLAELAVATPLTQLQNIRFRLDQLRLRRNPSVVEALRVRVAGQSLPSWSALASVFPGNERSSQAKAGGTLDTGGTLSTRKSTASGPMNANPFDGVRFASATTDFPMLGMGPTADSGSGGGGSGGGGGGSSGADPFERLGFFVNGELELGSQSATANQRGFDLRTHGLTAGVDYRLPGDSVVGVAVGLMNAKTDLNDAGGSQGARGYSLSAYGSFTPMQGAYVDVIAHAGSNKYDTRRREISSPGTGLDYTADTKGDQYAVAVTAGTDVSRGGVTINPYVRLDYVHAKINGFSEAGDAGAIKVDDLTLKTTIITLGGQVSYALSTSWGVFMPNARLELQRRVQGSGRIVGAQLVADGAINSQVALETVDRDYGNASLGFSVVLPRGVSGFANWERLFGRQNYSNSKFTVGVRFEF